MKDQLSAVIIPFPGQFRGAMVPQEMTADASTQLAIALEDAPPPVPTQRASHELASSSQRLSQALANLSTALADQREATERWKAAIEALAGKMRMLGEQGAVEKKLG